MDIDNKRDMLKHCPLCGKKMNNNEIYLCGGTPTLIHTCVNDIEIKIKAKTKHDVLCKWNAFVAVINK